MAVTAVELERQFIIEVDKKQTTLTDPNPALSVEDVKDMYSAQYPELLNAKIVPKGIENDKLVYEFKTIAGTKG